MIQSVRRGAQLSPMFKAAAAWILCKPLTATFELFTVRQNAAEKTRETQHYCGSNWLWSKHIRKQAATQREHPAQQKDGLELGDFHLIG